MPALSQVSDQHQFVDNAGEGERLILQVDSDLFRAFRKCSAAPHLLCHRPAHVHQHTSQTSFAHLRHC